MIGYHPYVIAALLLIHPHSTHQTFFYWYRRSDRFLEHDFRHEKPGSLFGNFLSIALGLATDVVCEKLDEDEKRRLCDLAMPFMIRVDRGGAGDFGSFLETDDETNPPLPVPQLVDASDPYTCKKIPIQIEGMEMEKRMYWCNSRRYRKYQSDEVAVAAGFFIASSRHQYARAFVFRPSPTDDRKVTPRAIMKAVFLLSTAYHRLDTATVAPVSE